MNTQSPALVAAFVEPTALERLEAFQRSVEDYRAARVSLDDLEQHILDQPNEICDEDSDERVELGEAVFFAGEEVKSLALVLAGNGVLARCIDLVGLENRGMV